MEINNFYKRYCRENLPIIITNFSTWKIGKDKIERYCGFFDSGKVVLTIHSKYKGYTEG